jgi:hypothetical protein
MNPCNSRLLVGALLAAFLAVPNTATHLVAAEDGVKTSGPSEAEVEVHAMDKDQFKVVALKSWKAVKPADGPMRLALLATQAFDSDGGKHTCALAVTIVDRDADDQKRDKPLAEALMTGVRASDSSAKLLESGDTSLGGVAATVVTFTKKNRNNGRQLKGTQWAVYRGDKTYIIMFVAESELFDACIADAKAVVKSFEFTGQK